MQLTVINLKFDTCLQPTDIGQHMIDSHLDSVYSIAPGENKNIIPILREDFAENLAVSNSAEIQSAYCT